MPYHPSLAARGLAPSSTFRSVSLSQGQQSSDWNRLWIVVDNIDIMTVKRQDGTKYAEIGGIRMKVEARQMEKNTKGELVDRKI